MRACRRFLAGIPHFGPGHPCVTHPSATPSRSEKQKDVRLACVRHAASVYPEPGSNSPSVAVCIAPPARRQRQMGIGTFTCFSSRDPGQAVAVLLVHYICTWLFADSRLSPLLCGKVQAAFNFLTGTAQDACASRSSCCLFCFPLFSCQGTLEASLARFFIAF